MCGSVTCLGQAFWPSLVQLGVNPYTVSCSGGIVCNLWLPIPRSKPLLGQIFVFGVGIWRSLTSVELMKDFRRRVLGPNQ